MRSTRPNHMLTGKKRKKKNKTKQKERQEERKRETHFDILILGKTMAFDLRKINCIASTTA